MTIITKSFYICKHYSFLMTTLYLFRLNLRTLNFVNLSKSDLPMKILKEV